MINRKTTRQIHIGNVAVGGNAPISIQSMLSVPTTDIDLCLREIHRLQEAGCDIVRLGVPDMDSARAFKDIHTHSPLPLVADIHFDHELALACLEAGVDGLRLNPGNIKKKEYVQEVVQACRKRDVPIRIGVNGGSIDKKKYPHPTPEALVDSALGHIRILEEMDYHEIKVSLKSSDVLSMIEAYQLFSRQSDYPLHLGVTEAGDWAQALVKSAIGMGVLLHQGIGDTIRVSITGDVVKEVEAGRLILRSLGQRMEGVEIVSCPTCARKEFDVESTVEAFLEKTRHIRSHVKVAIMGCIVNGPGEASEADLGVAVGQNHALLFKKGRIDKKLQKDQILPVLLEELDKFRE